MHAPEKGRPRCSRGGKLSTFSDTVVREAEDARSAPVGVIHAHNDEQEEVDGKNERGNVAPARGSRASYRATGEALDNSGWTLTIGGAIPFEELHVVLVASALQGRPVDESARPDLTNRSIFKP